MPSLNLQPDRLKTTREYLGYSLEEISQQTDIPVTDLEALELSTVDYNVQDLLAVSGFFKMPLAYFTQNDFHVEHDPDSPILARAQDQITDIDREEIILFKQFLSLRAEI